MFVLIFSGFDTFHAQGKIETVCRTFVIQTLPCYLTFGNKMLELTGKGIFQGGVNHGWHSFWCTSYLLLECCPNGAVLCKVALQEFTLLLVRHHPSRLLVYSRFSGLKVTYGGSVVWPNKQILSVFQWFFNLRHWYTAYC